MMPIFLQKAEELAAIWEDITSQPSQPAASLCIPPVKNAGSIVDIAHWVSRATFDVIGLAGFDYHFHALQDESEAVYLAYRRMFAIADKGPGLRGLLSVYFPFLDTYWVCFISHLRNIYDSFIMLAK